MILFFSGTGNSRYAAKRIAAACGDGLLSLNERIKAGNTEPISEEERLVVVTPTYAWRIPRLAEQWLEQTEFSSGLKVWFVMTCGSEIGNAADYNLRLAEKKKWTYMGTAGIRMPENYIAMFSVPGEAEAKAIIKKAEPETDALSAAIREGKPFPAPRRRLYDRAMSALTNPWFYRFSVKADKFRVEGSCVGCGSCAAICPLNNITLKDGRPVWGTNCTHCMACICRCPKEAIEYGRRSRGKPRYHLD